MISAIALTFRSTVALHPLIYAAVVGLTLWLVLSIWVLCRRGASVGSNLTMITVFFVIILFCCRWRRLRPA
jgi:hypothetical protein